jgi:AcrR family transcriptional regulator
VDLLERSGSKALPGDRLEPSRGEARRQAILTVIEELLSEESIEALSVGLVAKRAGITRSRFYFYFDSKYTALAVVLADAFGEMGQLTQDLFEGPGHGDLETYFRNTVTGVLAGWRRHAALLVAFMDSRFTDPTLAEMWRSWTDRLVDGITALLEQERARGRATPAHSDVRMVVEGLLTMTQQLVYEDCRRAADEDESQRTVDTLTAIWLAAAWGVHIAELIERDSRLLS